MLQGAAQPGPSFVRSPARISQHLANPLPTSYRGHRRFLPRGAATTMRIISRVDYDAIAHLYDGQPYRGKTVDPELVTFMTQRASSDNLSLLDIACGTGSQLVANRSIVPDARMVGLDRSLGMLRQAGPKRRISPGCKQRARCCRFGRRVSISSPANSGSIICRMCRHAAQRIRSSSALRAPGHAEPLSAGASRLGLLRVFPGSSNHRPRRFLALTETISAEKGSIGITAIADEPEHKRFEQYLRDWLNMVRRRDLNTQ